MYRSKKSKNSTQESVDLALLKNDIESMTKEYLLLGRKIQNRVIPTTAYPHCWRTIHCKKEKLNSDLKGENYYIGEDGVYLKENYDVQKECRAYLRGILVWLLAPAAKPDNMLDIVFGRYKNQTAYTAKERAELDALTLRFEKIFSSRELPNVPDFLLFPSELKVYLSYLREYYHPLREILSELWHGRLKAGDNLTEIFRKYEKTETLSAFRSFPFPAIFEIEGEEIILNYISEELFLLILSGLMTQKFINSHFAWRFFISTYFYGCNKNCLCN